MIILPFHLSCDKGLFTQSSLRAGQENSDSNTSVSARTGIPVEPDRCFPALARGACRKIVCLPWWNPYQDTIHQTFSGSMNIFIEEWPMNEWVFSPTWQFFPFWGQTQFSELLMDKHILFFCMHIYHKITGVTNSSQIWQKNKDFSQITPHAAFCYLEDPIMKYHSKHFFFPHNFLDFNNFLNISSNFLCSD